MFDIKIERKNYPFAMAEEFKNLRTSIIFSGEDIKTVLFTSCFANEGKSTITLELARSFAELDKKVIFIDCDLRKSILKRKIRDGIIKKGLTHYLTGQCSLEDIIYRNNPGREKDVEFFVIPAGPSTNSPTELLSSQKFSDLLAELRDEYDIIIIDTPPLGSVVDASIIGSKVDGSVLIVEAGGANYKVVKKVADKLVSSGSRLLGVALNKVDKSKKSYSYYKYGKDYGYGDKYGYGN